MTDFLLIFEQGFLLDYNSNSNEFDFIGLFVQSSFLKFRGEPESTNSPIRLPEVEKRKKR